MAVWPVREGDLDRSWWVREDVLVSGWAASSQRAQSSPYTSLAVTVRNDTGIQAKIVYLKMEDPKLGGPGVRLQQLPGVGIDDPNPQGIPATKKPSPGPPSCLPHFLKEGLCNRQESSSSSEHGEVFKVWPAIFGVVDAHHNNQSHGHSNCARSGPTIQW